jgi:hypothetical protein
MNFEISSSITRLDIQNLTYRSITTKFALITYGVIFSTAWFDIGDYVANAQMISYASFSIMPGQSVEKIFQVEDSRDPLSLIVNADSDMSQLALLISEVSNSSKTHTREPLVNTSFRSEFAFSFTPKVGSLYKLVVTNYDANIVMADIEILYLVPVGDKLDGEISQNIKIIIFFIVIFGSIILTATLVKFGIMGKNKHGVKLRKRQI